MSDLTEQAFYAGVGTISPYSYRNNGVAREYLYSIENNEWIFSTDKRVKRHPEKIKALLRSYARNTATQASVETILKDIFEAGGTISRGTADAYIRDEINFSWILIH